jgi:hypothetical protein
MPQPRPHTIVIYYHIIKGKCFKHRDLEIFIFICLVPNKEVTRTRLIVCFIFPNSTFKFCTIWTSLFDIFGFQNRIFCADCFPGQHY